MRLTDLKMMMIPMLLTCSGCTNWLYDVRTTPNGGVPFFPLEAQEIEKHVYEQDWVQLTINETFVPADAGAAAGKDKKKDKTGSNGVADEKKITRALVVYTDSTTAGTYYAKYVGSSNTFEAWKLTGAAILHELATGSTAVKTSLPSPETRPSIVKSFTQIAVARTTTQVPATKPAYFNVKLPTGGTANAEVDLNNNGTLGKGLSTKQDQLPGALLSTFGQITAAALGQGATLTSVATHFLGAAAGEGEAGEAVLKVDMSYTPVRRLYSLTLTRPSGVKLAECGDLDKLLQEDSASGCRLEISVETKIGEEKAPADDKGKIQFGGTVSLPKASDQKDKQ